MAKIFISYSRQDKEVVNQYTTALENYYHQIVMDDAVLTGGENMQKVLMDALKNADGTIVFLTKNSIQSTNVLSEIGIARSYLDNETNKKFLIPLVEANIEVPYIIQELHYLILDENRVHKTVEQIDDAIKKFLENKAEENLEAESKEETLILKKGSIGERVKEIQKALKQLGYIRSEIDGIFGASIVAAVKAFQTDNRLPVTGEVNEQTHQSLLSTGSRKEGSTFDEIKDEKINYWLIKINEKNWRKLEKGVVANYSTHTLQGERRPSYHYFQQVRKGDKALGYAYFKLKAIVCIFNVSSDIHSDSQYGEVISLNVEEVLDNNIPLTSFVDQITFNYELTEERGKKLFPISANVYKKILAQISQSNDKNTYRKHDIKSRLHSDAYSIDEADVLQYDLIAENLFTILTDEATNPPLNIGILAPWGRGKTSLMKRVKKKFDDARDTILKQQEDRQTKKMPKLDVLKTWLKPGEMSVKHNLPYVTVWFNPWNYQSSDMIWAGLADAVIQQTVAQIPGKIDQEIFWIQLRLSRIDKDELRKDLQTRATLYFLQFFIWGIVIILAAIYAVASGAATALGVIGFGSILGVISTVASKINPYSKSISEAFDKYTKPPVYTNKFGTFHEVETDLERVLESIDEKKPLIVFVDDLDRCSPSKVVEVIEAINVFINGKYNNKCYFILGMDAEMVAAALDTNYEKMKGKLGSKELEQGSIGWYFLDKFIQLPFFIPNISETKKMEYLEELLKEKEASSEEKAASSTIPDKEKIESVFTKVMSTGIIEESSKAIKDASLTREEKLELDKKILQHQVQSNQQNQEIKKQVTKYSKFISSDPRSLKRFANLLRFYSGYQFLRMKKGDKFVEINLLAKWLAIMLNFPQMIRWIQWDSENKSGFNNTAEDKAQIMDSLVETFLTDDDNSYDKWLNFSLPKNFYEKVDIKKIGDIQDMPWLKSKKLFDIIMNEASNGKFQSALECNIW